MTAWDLDPNHLTFAWRLLAGLLGRRKTGARVAQCPAHGLGRQT